MTFRTKGGGRVTVFGAWFLAVPLAYAGYRLSGRFSARGSGADAVDELAENKAGKRAQIEEMRYDRERTE